MDMSKINKSTSILILGDARHGKDELAKFITNQTGLKNDSSSRVALRVFLRDILSRKYGLFYDNLEDAFNDRVNHREIWYNEICRYNSLDKLRLVRDVLSVANIYVGLRSALEVQEAKESKVFDHIIGVYNWRVKRESKESNTADLFRYSDFIITNNGTLSDLENKVTNIILKIIL
ncbi:hypothetical protein Phi19:3_gp011 [Cellulophaga phage phi19:3]|uniref:Uncharacterized protein n=2 Tax=Baltivirus TaxID=2946816 RepID=S0A222_9CAUD|nr:hypothetical protein Phi19:3_gp011 [Cellulophaga phage phi19:3]YP_008241203.1 hypothetical protein Phi18:3_gp010 [Cellulophaga phage phi18:3]AGO47415.1 hypothetical protein Phi19:3_gp011 [Cellulophaga phage phi19:3]AGO48522.1 hypothetical protein Phi18:3_gp010 [Cellulophaga phage phi18:3]